MGLYSTTVHYIDEHGAAARNRTVPPLAAATPELAMDAALRRTSPAAQATWTRIEALACRRDLRGQERLGGRFTRTRRPA